VSRGPAPDRALADLRARARTGESAPAVAGVTRTATTLHGVPALCCRPHDLPDDDRVLLWFHGGGYRLGSAAAFHPWMCGLARACRIEVLSVDYRLAPEHPFPEALIDAVLTYSAVLGRRVVVGGESAGGGLAAALLLAAADRGLTAPAGAVLCSPWLDLRNAAESFTGNAGTDVLFPRAAADAAAGLYLAGHRAEDPYASPLLGDWADAPPVLVQASTDESLRDDARSLSEVAPSVRLRLFEGVPHAWHIGYPQAPASTDAVDDIARFVEEIAPARTGLPA